MEIEKILQYQKKDFEIVKLERMLNDSENKKITNQTATSNQTDWTTMHQPQQVFYINIGCRFIIYNNQQRNEYHKI